MSEPLLVTERLELWRPAPGDHIGLFAMTEPEPVRRFLGAKRPDPADSFARLLRNAGSWALYGYGVFQLREPGRPDIVGACGVFRSWRGFGNGLDDVPEAGWIIAQPSWGKGYAIEAMRAALAWFDREHGPQRIACMIEEGNEASARIAAKLGFVEYARRPEDDASAALVLYERLR